MNFFVAAATGAAMAKVQARYLLSAGLAITGLGLLLMGGLDPSQDWTALLAGFILAGAGVGHDQPGDRGRGGVGRAQGAGGMASGINDTFRQVGIAIGIAAWGAIFLGRGAGKVEELAAGTHRRHRRPPAPADRGRVLGQPRQRARVGAPGQPRRRVTDAAREGFLAGMNDILMLGGILAIAGAVAALWLVRERDIERGEVPVAEGVEAGGGPGARAGLGQQPTSECARSRPGRGRLLTFKRLQSRETGAIDSSVNGLDRMAAACGHPPSSPLRNDEGEAFS